MSLPLRRQERSSEQLSRSYLPKNLCEKNGIISILVQLRRAAFTSLLRFNLPQMIRQQYPIIFLDHRVKAGLEVCCKVSCGRWRRDRAGQKKAQGAGGVIQCHWQG